ncbi:NAD(P)-dependent oxidoreductase [Clostridiales bacterium BAD-6]|jgi:dihydropyrimidine dehydrogenase (NAD+) subunit PreT|uniref:dihydrouracil dehydrogenase (NAD(+)) n=1 Tax=Sinanaerobacter chloroacetimidivorans TaxID=2818044 RepID=A0A8J8B1Y9_9FIRM|nr:NAD(P)-dependent oxidoreductase [Sinanaerobacter chloroacetimidivorans]
MNRGGKILSKVTDKNQLNGKEIKRDYLDEAVHGYNIRTAMEEAARCVLCYDAPCSKGCPADTKPADFIRSIRFRNIKGAAATIREANALGGCTAKVCPYDRLCEEACSRTGIDRPIQIGRLQAFAVAMEKEMNLQVFEAPKADKEKVACIGSGPASLSCAQRLAREGYKVTIFEEFEKPGGVLTYGIIPPRLPQDVVDFDIQKVKDLGVEFVMNTKVGRDITIEDLKKQGFKAFFIGTGLWKSKEIDVKGKYMKGVTYAVDFLKKARSSNGEMKVDGEVIVIGGGDVAMDCASTAKLLGADRVTIVYRRSIEEAPADIAELEYVQALGVSIFTKFKPVEILGENEKVTGLLAEGTDGFSQLTLKADHIIFAIGQEAEDMKKIAEVELNDNGTIACDSNKGFTNIEGIFAAGDIVNGGKTVVEAVAVGKSVAESIMNYLSKKEGVQ